MNVVAAVKRVPLWKLCLLAFVAMCAQDIVSTAMVIYESRFLVVASGVCDVLGFLAGLVCSVLALDSILKSGWRNKRSLALIASISAANFCGTAIGVALVSAMTRH